MRWLICSLLFLAFAEATAAPTGTKTATSTKGIVVACEPLAAQVGLDILKSGGNAADAYIATTLAEYVTAYGYTSLSGPLYVLYYDAKSKKSAYLNAGLNTIQDPKGQWSDKDRIPGTAYVVGGAGRGLEALFNRYKSSKFSFSELTDPAVKLARTGFPISSSYAHAIQSRKPVLSTSSAWMSKFTKNGVPLAAGDILTQPDFAETLIQFGKEGADYLFKGRFAKNLVHTIQASGGKLTLQDLASYQVYWSEPLETNYRNFRVQTSSYRSFGGFELLLSLKALENLPKLGEGKHFSENEKLFETMLRAHLFTRQETFRFAQFSKRLETLDEMNQLLKGSLASAVWKKIIDPMIPAPFTQPQGSHSCNPVVVDREGNMVTGVHTINAQPWGDFGFFTDGVSLNTAHAVAMDAPPGVRALDSINPVLIFQNDKPIIAAGFFASGLSQAAFQIAVNLMDYALSPQKALELPRFGAITDYRNLTMLLDKRYPKTWVSDFETKGIHFSQPAGFADTGMGMIIRIDPKSGLRTGSATELVPHALAVGE